MYLNNLKHFLDELIDFVFTVSRFSVFDEMRNLLSLEPTGRVGQMESPEEGVGLLKVGPNSEDFMNKIFHTDDSKRFKFVFNHRVVSNWNALLVDLGEPALVDNFTHVFEVRISPCNVG